LGARYFGGTKPPIDWRRLGAGYHKVFYFDAIPVQVSGEDETTYAARVAPKRAELADIERQPGFHVRTGDARRRPRRGNEQKMVDVQLAVGALLMASRGLFASCALLTGDLDFKPLVDALVDMGVDVLLLYPPEETNTDLIAAADSASPMYANQLVNWIDPEFIKGHPFPTSSGEFQQPDEKVPIDALAVWQDQKYGRCYICTVADGSYVLRTERDQWNTATHRLEIKHRDKALVLALAENAFGIVPS
jgi:hypothetical protein